MLFKSGFTHPAPTYLPSARASPHKPSSASPAYRLCSVAASPSAIISGGVPGSAWQCDLPGRRPPYHRRQTLPLPNWCCNSVPPSPGRWISRTPIWETGHLYGNCSGLHIYNDIGKLVLRKPDDRAPAYTSTMIVENWYSVSRLTVLRRHEG